MPNCQNCGSHVTRDFVRVFAPTDVDEPRVYPECPDLIRDGAEVREARASRESSVQAAKFDSEQAEGDAA